MGAIVIVDDLPVGAVCVHDLDEMCATVAEVNLLSCINIQEMCTGRRKWFLIVKLFIEKSLSLLEQIKKVYEC